MVSSKAIMRTLFKIRPCPPMAGDVLQMIGALDAYQGSLYTAASNHLDSPQILSGPSCKFLGAYRDDMLVGIGAVKKFAGYGELKRFYVPDAFRGNGIAELLVATLEYWLIENQIYSSCLETGIAQHAALRFYKRLGYRPVGPFGTYREDTQSLFMAKNLSTADIKPLSSGLSLYVVGFSSHLKAPSEKYDAMADEMIRLARHQDGFVGINSTRSEDGYGFTASYWRDLESISKWRENSRHMEAQKLGRSEFYSSFRTSIACVEALSH